MAFIPTKLAFCSLPWFPICKIYRRLVLWATGAASTTKHENLLAESAMLSIDDTLTIHTESTWTKWKCFHDRYPISDLTTAATIAISKKKFSIRMASLAEVLTRRQTRSPDLYSPQTPLIDPCGKPPWIEGLSDSQIIVHSSKDSAYNAWAKPESTLSYDYMIYADGSKIDKKLVGTFFEKKIKFPAHPTFI
jgi:hypothetical protein